MLSLGYTKYLTQGGDWGSMTTRYLALSFPGNVKAVHLNYFSAVTGAKDAPGDLSALEQKGIERRDDFKHKGSAYQEIQGVSGPRLLPSEADFRVVDRALHARSCVIMLSGSAHRLHCREDVSLVVTEQAPIRR